MPDLRFDPSKAVTFDLARGLVHLEGEPARILAPAAAGRDRVGTTSRPVDRGSLEGGGPKRGGSAVWARAGPAPPRSAAAPAKSAAPVTNWPLI